MKLKTVKIGGKKYPVHYGMAALIEISKEFGAEPDNIFSALTINTLPKRLRLAQIGLCEGARMAKQDVTFPGEKEKLTEFADWLDQRPVTLEEIVGVYYLHTYGLNLDEFIKEAKKMEDEKVDKAIEKVKNAWPVLTGKASKLASVDYTK